MNPPSDNPPNNVSPSENVTCFIFDTRHYSITEERVKYGAFLPDKGGERSVFRIIHLTNDHIKFIGDYVGRKRSRALLARGTLKVQNVTDTGLNFIPQGDPDIPLTLGRWHSVIIGWPTQKEDQRERAIDLANTATLDSY